MEQKYNYIVTVFILTLVYILQGPDGEVDVATFVAGGDIAAYCERMTKDGEWADHVTVMVMTRILQMDIVIVTSVPGVPVEEAKVWVVGRDGFSGEPLMLGHIHENHYESLEPLSELLL